MHCWIIEVYHPHVPAVLSVQLSCLVLVNSCCFVTTASHPISSTQAACWACLGSPSLYCYLTLCPQAVRQAIVWPTLFVSLSQSSLSSVPGVKELNNHYVMYIFPFLARRKANPSNSILTKGCCLVIFDYMSDIISLILSSGFYCTSLKTVGVFFCLTVKIFEDWLGVLVLYLFGAGLKCPFTLYLSHC